jgi:hypothetical protein
LVLDADFFRYAPELKAKIHEVFQFMYASNLRERNPLFRAAVLLALGLSRKLDAASPALERAIFHGPAKLLRRIRGLSR